MAIFPADFGRKIKRYVQIADQNLGRAEKSEVLTDQIHGMEKQMELIRQAFQGVVKRLQACLPSPADPEKRLRKLPESFLSSSLLDSAGLLSQSHHVFPTLFSRLGEAEKSLAEALIQYTLNIEKNVIEPLNNVVDKDIPAIIKLRKELTKATLDMDSAKKAYSTLQRQGQPGKIDSARDGVDAEEIKVDQCRDQLITEMYQFFAHEEKLCKWLLSVLQLQADYHRRSIELLDQQIAQMSEEIEQKTVKPVYGCDLKEHLTNTMKEIATVIEVCVQTITEKHGLDTEGLFRIAPSASKLRKLTAAFDANIDDVDWDDIDAHCLAGALKLYLRELPEPLMTFELYNDWSSAAQRTGPDKLDALLDVLRKLPKANYDNLKYLIQFIARITEHSDTNKMSSSNLAIVIAPNLLYPSKADQGGVKVSGVAMTAVEPLITNANWFFSEQRSGSFSRLDLNKGEVNGEEYKGPTALHRPLQRLPPILGLNRAKKAFAPAPPIGQIGKQRSESAPEYQPGPDLADYTLPRNIEPEKLRPVQPYERTIPTPGKPMVPPPLPPKKSASEQPMDDRGFVENSRTFESKEMACNSPLHMILENPLSVTTRTFQDEAPDGDSVDGTMEDDGSSTVEVFSPLGSCSSPDADNSVNKSEDNRCDDSVGNLEFTTKTQPNIASLDSTADLQNVAPATRVEETNKTFSGPSLQSPRSPRRKPNDEPTTPTSVSPSSLLLTLGRNKPTDITAKSASLPTQKKLPVELCRVTPRSESTDNPDVYAPPRSKDVAVETGKLRPKAPPPRVPPKETRARVEGLSKDVPEEATHL